MHDEPTIDAVASQVPGPSFSITMRILAPATTALLPNVTAAIAGSGATVVAVDLVGVEPTGATVDASFYARSDEHVELVRATLQQAGYEVRHTSDRTFLSHLGGTIVVQPKVSIRTRDDLSIAYTPGVARIASAIASAPQTARNLTIKGNSVAIVTDGSAVLGLGDIGPLAALPVMEGKAALFKTFGGVDAYPLCLGVHSVVEIVETVCAIAPGFGGINLEDISAPRCFEIEQRLAERLDIPVFHDDQHGTAIVVLAGLLNACRITGRSLAESRAVVVGVGAAGYAISEALLGAGIGDLVAVDLGGPLDPHSQGYHAALARRTNKGEFKDLRAAMSGSDIFVGVAKRGSVDPSWFELMAPRPIIFALSNPEPEAFPDEVPLDAILATGRSDLPNQVNNALCFPGFFRGCLDARASRVTDAMKLAAARALAEVITDEERAVGLVVPSLFHPEVHRTVADAVRRAAALP